MTIYTRPLTLVKITPNAERKQTSSLVLRLQACGLKHVNQVIPIHLKTDQDFHFAAGET